MSAITIDLAVGTLVAEGEDIEKDAEGNITPDARVWEKQARTPEQLGEWILSETATKSEALTRTINGLVNTLNSGSEYRWDAAANGLEITEKKTRRRKR